MTFDLSPSAPLGLVLPVIAPMDRPSTKVQFQLDAVTRYAEQAAFFDTRSATSASTSDSSSDSNSSSSSDSDSYSDCDTVTDSDCDSTGDFEFD